jgi:hypothetical protein
MGFALPSVTTEGASADQITPDSLGRELAAPLLSSTLFMIYLWIQRLKEVSGDNSLFANPSQNYDVPPYYPTLHNVRGCLQTPVKIFPLFLSHSAFFLAPHFLSLPNPSPSHPIHPIRCRRDPWLRSSYDLGLGPTLLTGIRIHQHQYNKTSWSGLLQDMPAKLVSQITTRIAEHSTLPSP